MKKQLISIIAIFIATISCYSHKYIVDFYRGDSIEINNILINHDKTECAGAEVAKIAIGDTITVTRCLTGNSSLAAFKLHDQEFCISSGNLIFCHTNKEGVKDIFGEERDMSMHTETAHFFGTMLPYWLICICFAMSFLLTLLGYKIPSLRKIVLIMIPIFILGGSVIEIWAIITIESEAFWWCDKDVYGFWGSLIRLVPFVAIVLFQFWSFFLYKAMIECDHPHAELSIKPIVIRLSLALLRQ